MKKTILTVAVFAFTYYGFTAETFVKRDYLHKIDNNENLRQGKVIDIDEEEGTIMVMDSENGRIIECDTPGADLQLVIGDDVIFIEIDLSDVDPFEDPKKKKRKKKRIGSKGRIITKSILKP